MTSVPMESKRSRLLDGRAFVTAMIAITAIGLPITGLLNHHHQAAPMDLSRHSWMAAHNVMGLLFTLFAVWHVVHNGRRMLRSVRGVARGISTVRREVLLAGALVATVLALSIGHAWVV